MLRKVIFIMTAVATVSLSDAAWAHEVIGLWTFSGEPGARIEDDTEFQNSIEGSELKLKTVRWSGTTVHYRGKKPVFVNEVPAGNLFGDAALTNRIAGLGASIRMEGGSETAGYEDKGYCSGSALEIPNFGKVLGTSESWTVEILARATNTSSNASYRSGSTVSLLGVGCNNSENAFPAVVVNPVMNGGQLLTYANETKISGVNFSGVNRISGRSVMQDCWRSIMLSYDASSGKAICRIDYDDGGGQQLSVTTYDFGVGSVFRIGGMWGPSTNGVMPGTCFSTEALGCLDVAAVRVSRGVVARWDAMMSWVDAVPKRLVHYRFNGAEGSSAARVANAVAPELDFTMCANLKNYDWTTLENSTVYTNFSSCPFVQTQSVPQKRLENAGSVSSLTNGAWGTLKYFMQNLPAYYADSFTIETIFWSANAGDDLVNNRISVDLFRAPNSTNGLRFQYRQNQFFVDLYGVSSSTQILATPWDAYYPERQAWQHVALVYDKPSGKVSVYLNRQKLTSFANDKDGTVPAGAQIVKPGLGDCSYAQILGDADGWARAFKGLIDEFRITRGVLVPEDFLIPRMSGLEGLMIFCR